jgi:hypothetical protein
MRRSSLSEVRAPGCQTIVPAGGRVVNSSHQGRICTSTCMDRHLSTPGATATCLLVSHCVRSSRRDGMDIDRITRARSFCSLAYSIQYTVTPQIHCRNNVPPSSQSHDRIQCLRPLQRPTLGSLENSHPLCSVLVRHACVEVVLPGPKIEGRPFSITQQPRGRPAILPFYGITAAGGTPACSVPSRRDEIIHEVDVDRARTPCEGEVYEEVAGLANPASAVVKYWPLRRCGIFGIENDAQLSIRM